MEDEHGEAERIVIGCPGQAGEIAALQLRRCEQIDTDPTAEPAAIPDLEGITIDGGDRAALAAALRRNIHPQAGEAAPSMDGLAGYLVAAERAMAAIAEDDIAVGALTVREPGPEEAPA